MSLRDVSAVQLASRDAHTVVGVFAVTLGGCLSFSLSLGLALVCSIVGVLSVATCWWWVGAFKSSARSGKSVDIKHTVICILSVTLRGCFGLGLGVTLVCAVVGVLAVVTSGRWVRT